MTTFWKVRIATALYGFAVTYAFTGRLWGSVTMMIVLILGNTILMKWLIK